MKGPLLQDKNKKITFIISLLLHLFLIFIFSFHAFKQNKKFIFPKPLKKLSQRESRAALLPKKSDGGTKIVFDNSKILPKLKQKTETKEQNKPVKKLTERKPIEKPVKMAPPKKLAKKPITKKIIPKESPRIAIRRTTALQESPDRARPKTPVGRAQGKKPVKKITKKTTIKKPIDTKKTALNNLVKKQKKEEQKIKKIVKKIADPKPTKPKKSLLSLTKTFLDHPKGNSCMVRFGQNRNPTLEDMKYICYEKRIQDEIVSSWRSLYGWMNMKPNGSAKITFLINKNGGVEDLTLLSSSGNRSFDQMVLNSISKANFPPIPKHFGVEKYRPQGGMTVLK